MKVEEWTVFNSKLHTMRVKDFGSGLNNDGLNIGMVYQHYGSILEKKLKYISY